MNCLSCNAKIDYRFLTNCSYCDCELEKADCLQSDSSPALPPARSGENAFTWRQRAGNVACIFVSAIVGMTSGAVLVYFTGAMVCAALLRDTGNPGENCARGTAIGFLLIVLGAWLGTIGGSVFAVKHRLGECAVKH
jgi:hypothetical protein